MVIWQVESPVTEGASTETDKDTLPPTARLPEAGTKWHQLVSMEEAQELLAVPVLVRVRLFGAGAGSPETTGPKDREVVDRDRWDLFWVAEVTVTVVEAVLLPEELVAVKT